MPNKLYIDFWYFDSLGRASNDTNLVKNGMQCVN
jgi:hypothetical protein